MPALRIQSAPGSRTRRLRLGRHATGSVLTRSLPSWAQGILAEHVRWAEVEQLGLLRQRVGTARGRGNDRVYALEACTSARRAQVRRAPRLSIWSYRSSATRSDTVRKSLSWALRSWREGDPRGVDELTT